MFKDNQLVKAWESTIRKTTATHHQEKQQHSQHHRRRSVASASMSILPNDDQIDVSSSDNAPSTPVGNDETGSIYHAERVLSTGDFYTGQWCGKVPHGQGKYLWTDGCMYEGEWHNGKTMGKGKFSWPSGATYEGEFKAGFMDGYGTYIGALGDTYRGTWSINLKHGHGVKSFASGDYYDGEWRCGVQDGHGRYVWKNGNEYVGQWRAGIVDGRGTLVWANGNRYDGGWENGLPKGNGNFRWADGGLYIGYWSKENGNLQQKGVYNPSPTASSPTARDPYVIFMAGLGDCKVSNIEDVSILPSQKTLNWPGTEADNLAQKQAAWRSSKTGELQTRRRRASIETAAAIGATSRGHPGHHASNTIGGIGSKSGFWYADDLANGCDEENEEGRRSEVGGTTKGVDEFPGEMDDQVELRGIGRILPTRLPAKEAKKQGDTISKGHKNYELMLNLQLGIR